jgi:hypothetical protein
MLVQPKILTVIVANDDIVKSYATIRSAQEMRYRNHEIVCIVPSRLKRLYAQIKRDFNWLPIISIPYASLSTLLGEAVARGRYAHVDGFCFVQSGTRLESETLTKLAEQLRLRPTFDLFMPVIDRGDGRTVYGALPYGRWPHQLRPITTLTEETEVLPDSYFLGPICLVKASVCYNHPFSEMRDDLTLLYWNERLQQNEVKTAVITDIRILFDGTLYSDVTDSLVIPKGWFEDIKRYVETKGNAYDRLLFWLQYSWRSEGSLVSRLFMITWSHSRLIHSEQE